MADLPEDVLAAMYPTGDDGEGDSSPAPSASSGGIAIVGDSGKLSPMQERLCSESGLAKLDSPQVGEEFLDTVNKLEAWAKEATPAAILFDRIDLAAGLAQKLNLPVLRATSAHFDAELSRIRCTAPLWTGIMEEESAARDQPQVIFVL